MHRLISAFLKVFRVCGALTALAAPVVAFAAEPPRIPAIASFDAESEAVLSDPRDLAIGPDGRLYVSDTGANRIAIMDPETLEIVGEFGGFDLSAPHDVSFGPDGRLYVADTGNYRVAVYRIVDGAGVFDGEAAMGVPAPEGVLAHSDGALYVTSSAAGMVAVFRGEELVAALRGFSRPHDVIDDGAGGVWVADSGNNRFVHLSPEFEVTAIIDDPALGLGGPRYMDLTAGGMILAADKFADRIKLIAPEGRGRIVAMLGDPGDADQTEFLRPNGAEADGAVFYFSDGGSGRVIRYRLVLN